MDPARNPDLPMQYALERVPAPPAAAPWKVLIADDVDEVHKVTTLALGGFRFRDAPLEFLHAHSGEAAVERMRAHPDVAVILMDVIMENEQAGLDAVRRIRQELHNERVRIVLRTGQAPERELQSRFDIDDYRDKSEMTARRLATVMHMALNHYSKHVALERSEFELAQAQSEMVVALSEAIEARSLETGFHIRRVAEYARLLGELAGLSSHEANLLFLAAPLHDAGKIGITDAVLNKPGPHTPEETQAMRMHPELGRRIFADRASPVLQAAAIVASEHHERWDGLGYPNGLAGENIHIFGRITALADVFDALTTARCYKQPWPLKRTLEYLRAERGRRFDPKLVDLFLEHLTQFMAIFRRLADPPAQGVPSASMC
jgi:response regulator RpfG family c-di-GMP phosphodiesterase